MKNETIFKKAIEKAVESGYLKGNDWWYVVVVAGQVYLKENEDIPEDIYSINDIIFSHDFAQAFWGEEILGTSDEGKHWFVWQRHLEAMVREKDPIRYLEKFL